MRRIDIINAAANIKNALVASNMADIIRSVSFTSSEKKLSFEGIATGFYKYQSDYQKFGKAEKYLLKVFNLEGLEAPKTLAMAMSNDKDGGAMIRHYFSRVNFAVDFLPDIVEMLKQDNVSYNENKVAAVKSYENDRQLITLILPENGGDVSSPERLIKAIDSINKFYEVLAKIYNLSSNDLSVAAIDSGSDKSFDFLGAAKLMESVKELIMGLWDRIVYYREKKLHEKLDLVAKSLPLLEQISGMEKDGKLGREQCEILRRDIMAGATNFIESGAILPEFSRNNYYNPRELMAPEPKLLVESSEYAKPRDESEMMTSETEISDDEGAEGGLSDEEKELLKKIKAKRKKK